MDELSMALEKMLQGLLFIENKVVEGIDKLVPISSEPLLIDSLQKHRELTLEQIERLEQVFKELNLEAKETEVASFELMIDEGVKRADMFHNDVLKNMAVIGLVLKVEHLEIASYQAAYTLALLGAYIIPAELLLLNLGEEMATSSELSVISGLFIARGTVGGSEPMLPKDVE